ncbi:MAG: undecaprenyldiphospho-muramoylpentapeptide beta-N-acetylglucosaminyltransferase [Crocinitomicaceae bacterium]|nr:undecaprenyldiphospho-muramoylpentapeptide beta-N-acetylglucosaminyltransferase [Crocinitomicaceae bacterium]
MNRKIDRVVISGGGTGGHIFPAIAIADEIKRRNPEVEILFVGAVGKMEMERVPKAGYSIEGLPIVGLQRKLTFSNFLLPFKLFNSLLKARRIIKNFKPQLVIGVGGYASGPTLKMAQLLGIPTVIQEQNSFPGKTNILLSKKASLICTAYTNLEQFFSKEKIRLTGNPVRQELSNIKTSKEDALEVFGLSSTQKTALVIGGSLGAKTLNDAMLKNLEQISNGQLQFIWQCGKGYIDQINQSISKVPEQIKLMPFISQMDAAYAAADVVVSRAGALSVSELCLVGKPVILVPSPNVSEDHQTKNAMALVSADSAILMRDADALEDLVPALYALVENEDKKMELSSNIKALAKPNATEDIVDACETLLS